MAKAHSISPKEKLQLLQSCDHWRKWESLGEKRYCVMCECTFTGREVRITLDRRDTAVAHCPTPDCSATPREWLHPGNPLTDDTAWQDWLRIIDDLSDNEPASAHKHGISSYVE